MKISFLFGSGISIPAGFPNITKITNNILSGKNIFPNISGINLEQLKLERIIQFINILKVNFKDHYSFRNRKMNYEDIYYLADSIHQDENMNYENPIVYFYSKNFEKEYPRMLESIYPELAGKERIIDLASYTKDYISEIVAGMLSMKPEHVEYLDFLCEIFRDEDLDYINIFSLNHDKLIEEYFHTKRINFSDGFNKNGFWDGTFGERLKLLKLHGSIDWFDNIIDDPYLLNVHKNAYRDNGLPLLLIGSFNKLHEYSRNLNFKLQVLFYNYLNETNFLIISGYGFGDQGINSKIFLWLYSSMKNRIILIHKDIDILKKTARPAILNKLDTWISRGILINIPKYIEEILWEEIKDIIQGIG